MISSVLNFLIISLTALEMSLLIVLIVCGSVYLSLLMIFFLLFYVLFLSRFYSLGFVGKYLFWASFIVSTIVSFNTLISFVGGLLFRDLMSYSFINIFY